MADEAVEPAAVEVEVDFEARTVVTEPSGPSLLARLGAEVAGTFILVLLGVGAALFSATGNNGTLAVGLSFGVAVIIAAFAFGNVSGAHLNPADLRRRCGSRVGFPVATSCPTSSPRWSAERSPPAHCSYRP